MKADPVLPKTGQTAGGFPWGFLLAGLPLAMVVALFVGFVLALVFQWGGYIRFLVPLLACLPVAGVVWLIAALAQCRPPLVGGAFGVVVGLAMYLSSYHFDFVNLVGIGALHRVDALPEYISFRMQTDVSRRDFRRNRANARDPNQRTAGNWIAFILEGIAVAAVTASAGYRGASGLPFSSNQDGVVGKRRGREMADEDEEAPTSVSTGVEAEVEDVPEPYGGRVLTPTTKLVELSLGSAPLIALPLALVCFVVAWLARERLGGGGMACLVLAGLALPVLAWLFLTRVAIVVESGYLHGRTRQAIRERPDAIVDPDDPKALFVEMVPRANWGRMMIDTAEDLGFLRVDAPRRRILFEGDRQRYRIPGAAVADCKVKTIEIAGMPVAAVVVLRFRVDGQVVEVPLARRARNAGQTAYEEKLKSAKKLCARLRTVMPDQG